MVLIVVKENEGLDGIGTNELLRRKNVGQVMTWFLKLTNSVVYFLNESLLPVKH